MSATLSLVVAAALLAFEPAAAASTGPVDVGWSAPPGCPGPEALIDGIARRGGSIEGPGARVAARIEALPSRRFRMDLEVEVSGRRERRVLHAKTCVALVDAAALRIAVAFAASPEARAADSAPVEVPDDAAGESEGEGDAAPTPPDPSLDPLAPAMMDRPDDAAPELAPADAIEARAPELLAPSDPLEPTRPPRRRRVPGGLLRLHGLGELGALPGVSGGLGLAGGLLWPRLRVELHATYIAPRRVTSSVASVSASLIAGALHTCARLGRGRLEVPICGGLELGGMPGAAVGPGVDGAALGRWLAAAITVGASWRVRERVALWGAIHGLAAVQRSVFLLRDPGPEIVLFDPGVLSGRLALGVELRFGDPRTR